MKNLICGVILLFWVITLSSPVLAHSDEYFDTVEAPHGGQLRMAGPFHLELVAEEGELFIYVTDHMDKEIPTEGGSGKANIIGENGDKVSVELKPSSGNLLKGKGSFKITPETVVSVFLALEGYETQGARFTPLAPKVASDDAKNKNNDSDDHDHHNHHDHEDDDLDVE